MKKKVASYLFEATAGRVIILLRKQFAFARLKKYPPRDYFVTPIPCYISQLADAKKSSIEKFYGKISDKKAAQKFGAKNLAEFSYWAWRACSITDLQMILTTLSKRRFKKKTMDLINEGLALKGYNTKTDTGWYHESLKRLAQKYGLDSECRQFTPSLEVAQLLIEGFYILASVKSIAGGHLVLLYGVKLGREGKVEGFYLHDPNNYLANGKAQFMSQKKFNNLFNNRIMMLKSNNGN